MKKEIILGDGIMASIGPFSPGVKVENLLFLSGQGPLNEKGEIAGTTIQEQTKAVMDNIGKILKKAGGSFDNLVSVTVYLRTLDDVPGMNEVYAAYFDGSFPARTTVQAGLLSYKGTPFRIEVQAVAALDKQK